MHTSPWQTAYWWYEAGYHKWHGLIPVDEFLTVKKTPYRGQPRQLRDGTRIEPGDALLTLHFNNRFLARVQRERGLRSPRQAVMIFGRSASCTRRCATKPSSRMSSRCTVSPGSAPTATASASRVGRCPRVGAKPCCAGTSGYC